ncbi:hypothetical protein LZZ90_08235 [Flavobacterium sp. SM15]|uniref:hypothetical protein n=1 Tax=Flavobacterium sp. SM15 TaxID=2908005 RepID=UPI001ED9DD02|nr:hypothetical protein [Flavobacterium sp. SM15]MCG2611494.1 hypothetical protein [Flavobacterium sp. SM15]
MDEEFLRKIGESTGEFNRAKSIADLAGAFSSQSPIDLVTQRNLSAFDYRVPAVTAMANSLRTQDFDSSVKVAYGRVVEMMNQMQFYKPVSNPISKSMIDIVRDFLKNHEEALKSHHDITKIKTLITSGAKFDTFNWRETYPEFFTKEKKIEGSSEYSKFNDNLDKLIGLSIIDENSTLVDGVALSVNLDSDIEAAELTKGNEEIFSIANQTIEELFQGKTSYEEIYNEFLLKLEKFVYNQYTVGLTVGIISSIISGLIVYFIVKNIETSSNVNEVKTEQIIPKSETILTEQVIHVKKRGDKTSKTVATLPIGIEITIEKRYRTWTKIKFIKDYNEETGFCLNTELIKSK